MARSAGSRSQIATLSCEIASHPARLYTYSRLRPDLSGAQLKQLHNYGAERAAGCVGGGASCRRRSGLALMIVFVMAGCYPVRTAQSQAALPGADEPMIAVNVKVFVNGVDAIAARGYGSEGWNALTSNGGQFWLGDDEHKEGCVARVAAAGRTAASGARSAGLILLSCELSHAGRTFATPTLLVRDNEPSALEVTDTEDSLVLRLEFSASTTSERVAAASAYWKDLRMNGTKTFQLKKP